MNDLEIRKKTSFMLTNYSHTDKSAAPEGHSVICIVELMSFADWNTIDEREYLKRKETVEKIIIEKAERITGIPLKENIEIQFSGTPRTMAKYSSTPEGAMAGASATLDQVLNKRTQVDTPIKNLFLAGSSVAFVGVSTTLESGYLTAQELLRKI